MATSLLEVAQAINRESSKGKFVKSVLVSSEVEDVIYEDLKEFWGGKAPAGDEDGNMLVKGIPVVFDEKMEEGKWKLEV